jgi:hypothetical protein
MAARPAPARSCSAAGNFMANLAFFSCIPGKGLVEWTLSSVMHRSNSKTKPDSSSGGASRACRDHRRFLARASNDKLLLFSALHPHKAGFRAQSKGLTNHGRPFRLFRCAGLLLLLRGSHTCGCDRRWCNGLRRAFRQTRGSLALERGERLVCACGAHRRGKCSGLWCTTCCGILRAVLPDLSTVPSPRPVCLPCGWGIGGFFMADARNRWEGW